jgi:beta-glucosidase/6-phospho-beta-glucosidase/beta-galactosidase
VPRIADSVATSTSIVHAAGLSWHDLGSMAYRRQIASDRGGGRRSGGGMTEFMFATGIENSYPTIAGKNGENTRIDEMEKCGFYTHWQQDFSLVKQLGIRYLRFGPPYYKSHTGPGTYDWSFADETFAKLRELGITPIADLCHFGVPDWIGNFQNSDWPPLFAEYAKAFATRYPEVHHFTPVNEIFVAATFSAQYGWWNERLASDHAFVTAIKNLCKANVLAMRAILEVRPNATFVQSESSSYYHAEEPSVMPHANFLNEKRFLALDLTYGYPTPAPIYQYLLDNGMSRAEYQWFQDHHVKAHCVLGTDYYAANEQLVKADGTLAGSGELYGYYIIMQQYFNRYRLPVMHTETNYPDPQAVQWLRKQWANMVLLKEAGTPIVGFTWYSLTDQVDWDTALRDDRGKVNPLGLCDLDRNVRAVGHAYQQLIARWRDILPTPSLVLTLGY